MIININRLLIVFGLVCLTIISFESVAQTGGMSYEQKLSACAACHGVNGDKPVVPNYPILAGQYADYLVNSLQAYKSGRRKHPIMNAQVKLLGLTDSDIKKMGQYFSKKKSLRDLAE